LTTHIYCVASLVLRFFLIAKRKEFTTAFNLRCGIDNWNYYDIWTKIVGNENYIHPVNNNIGPTSLEISINNKRKAI
jgi:hypothetical protein